MAKDSDESHQQELESDTRESAWERWELPFFEPGAQSVIAGRTVSCALEALLGGDRPNEAPVEPRLREVTPSHCSADGDQPADPAYQAGFDQGYDEGKLNGFSEGFEKGLSEGRLKAEAELECMLSEHKVALNEVIDRLHSHATRLDDELVDRLCDLLKYTLKLIVPEALEHSSDRLRQLVHKAVEGLPTSDDALVITMHPDDVSIFEKADSEIPDSWVVRDDSTMERGTVWVEGQAGYSELNIPSYIDELWLEVKDGLIPRQAAAVNSTRNASPNTDDQHLSVAVHCQRDEPNGE